MKKRKIKSIHSVERVGGGTRIPAIQQIITDAFQTKISKTLDADECVARGCAVQAAVESVLFSVAKYNLGEFTRTPTLINLKYEPDGNPVQKVLFKEGQ